MPSMVKGLAAPFPLSNVDTDVIMPKRFLRTITREGLADGVMADLRFNAEGEVRPEFFLNRIEYANPSILVVGDNFGCGSSREHAVWGLKQLGIQAIVGTSFAGIFYDNARKNVLALAGIEPELRDALLKHLEQGAQTVTVDLEAKTVVWGEQAAPIAMDAATQQSLISERDDVSDTLRFSEQIKTFEQKQPAALRVKVPT